MLKGGSDDVVTFICGVNIFEDSAHPGVGTDMWIGRLWATEGAENIDDCTIVAHISGQVGIDGFSDYSPRLKP